MENNLGLIISVIVGLVSAYFLYGLSKKNNVGNPMVFAICGFLFALPAWIVYLVMSSSKK